MALNQDAVLKLSRADFYVAPVDTPAPKDLSIEPTSPWVHTGHTSIEDILAATTDGGESTTLGSIQAASLRQSTTAAIRSFTVNHLQWDTETLKLYYGDNAIVQSDGSVDVPETPIPSEKAWLARLQDGNTYGGFYAKRASIIGDGDISISDSDSLAQIPVKYTPMISGSDVSSLKFIPMKKKATVVSGGSGH